MPLVDPSHPLFQLLQRDRRYSLDAYLFVLEALSFAQESLGMGQEPRAEDLEAAAVWLPRADGTRRLGDPADRRYR